MVDSGEVVVTVVLDVDSGLVVVTVVPFTDRGRPRVSMICIGNIRIQEQFRSEMKSHALLFTRSVNNLDKKGILAS